MLCAVLLKCLNVIKELNVFFYLFFFICKFDQFTFQFMQQYRHYQATVKIFQLRPTQNNGTLTKLVMFLAQVNLRSFKSNRENEREFFPFREFLNFSIKSGKSQRILVETGKI